MHSPMPLPLHEKSEEAKHFITTLEMLGFSRAITVYKHTDGIMEYTYYSNISVLNIKKNCVAIYNKSINPRLNENNSYATMLLDLVAFMGENNE